MKKLKEFLKRVGRLAGTWPLLTFVFVVVVLGGVAFMAWPVTTTFTVRAQTDSLSIEPGCGQTLIWDLPPGEVRALGGDSPLGQPRKIGPVSLVIREGTRTVLERWESGEWHILSKPLEGLHCEPATSGDTGINAARSSKALPAAARITALRLKYEDETSGETIENELVEPSADGYAYRSVGGEVQPASLRLAGRIVLGSPVLEGSGWSDSRPRMLRSASIEGRVRVGIGEQMAVLLREDVDLGSMVDTHACLMENPTEAERLLCANPGDKMAVGFATPSLDMDSKTIDVVVHHEAESIGILPYAGDQRRLSVTWWTWLLRNPFAQQIALALVVLTQLISHYKDLTGLFRNKGDEKNNASGK